MPSLVPVVILIIPRGAQHPQAGREWQRAGMLWQCSLGHQGLKEAAQDFS